MTPEQRIALPDLSGNAVCGVVTITDKVGSHYEFPDVNVSELKRVLPESGRVPANAPCLTVINVAMAVLSVPLRNVERVCVGEEELWHA